LVYVIGIAPSIANAEVNDNSDFKEIRVLWSVWENPQMQS